MNGEEVPAFLEATEDLGLDLIADAIEAHAGRVNERLDKLLAVSRRIADALDNIADALYRRPVS